MFKRVFRFFTVVALFSRIKVDNKDDELTPVEQVRLDSALGDAIRDDGSVDTARLKDLSQPIDIDAWRREVAGDKPQVASPR